MQMCPPRQKPQLSQKYIFVFAPEDASDSDGRLMIEPVFGEKLIFSLLVAYVGFRRCAARRTRRVSGVVALIATP